MAEVNLVRTRVSGNRLVPYLARHCFAGMLAGWTAVGALLLLDVGGLGRLIFGAEAWLLALAMLLAFFGLTFGSVAMGAAIMCLGHRDDPSRGLMERWRRLCEPPRQDEEAFQREARTP